MDLIIFQANTHHIMHHITYSFLMSFCILFYHCQERIIEMTLLMCFDLNLLGLLKITAAKFNLQIRHVKRVAERRSRGSIALSCLCRSFLLLPIYNVSTRCLNPLAVRKQEEFLRR